MNIQSSWAAFDEQVQTNRSNNTTQNHSGVDSLYISQTSENVAPATVALLRQSGLTSASSSTRNSSNNNNDSQLNAEENEEEFRLRFHWMRPHPSVVFSIEDEMARSGKKKQEESSQSIHANPRDDTQNRLPQNRQQQEPTPAVTTAKMMQVYRDAKIEQHETQMEEEGGNEDIIQLEEDSDCSQSGNMKAGDNYNNSSAKVLPFEHPELRVDLSSLVEPPLMTSWLPSAESIDTAYRDD